MTHKQYAFHFTDEKAEVQRVLPHAHYCLWSILCSSLGPEWGIMAEKQLGQQVSGAACS